MPTEVLEQQSVLTLGAGKAATELHGPIWHEAGFVQAVYDTNPGRLEFGLMSAKVQAAVRAGNLSVVHSLADVETYHPVLDVASSSGTHAEALEAALGVYRRLGRLPAAILLEKPIISGTFEKDQLLELLSEYPAIAERTLVNENYNASIGVAKVKEAIDQEVNRGNELKRVDVVFYKDRSVDVKGGRFTDPELGAFGIELPHQIAVAYHLGGVMPNEPVDVIEDTYFQEVASNPYSEGTYTHVRTRNGIDLHLAQGLGPYIMDADGAMERVEVPPTQDKMEDIVRYASAHFADGSSAVVTFDPAPGVPRYHSIVTKKAPDGETISEETFADNTLQRVIGGVVLLAQTGQKPDFADGLSIPSAIAYVEALARFRREASVVIG